MKIKRPDGLTITKFERVGQREWTARVTLEGITVDVEYRDGSWKQVVRAAPRVHRFVRREVTPAVAAALQEKMPSWMRTSATFWNDAQKAAAAEPFTLVDQLINKEGFVNMDALATSDVRDQAAAAGVMIG